MSDNADLGIHELIAQFAVSLKALPDVSGEVLAAVVEGAVALIPGTDHAAVVLPDRSGQLTARAVAGDKIPRLVMDVENETGQGPTFESIRTGEQVLVADVAADPRWPRFAAGAVAAGVGSMLLTALRLNGKSLGSLTLIGSDPAFDDESLMLARVFAAHAAIALADAQDSENLLAALDGRDVIGQAKGILMERFSLSPHQAFAVLVRTSSTTNMKLRVVCEQLCRTGTLAEAPGSQS